MSDATLLRRIAKIDDRGAVIVVHNGERRRCVEQMVAARHSTTTAKLVVVRVVDNRMRALELLEGRVVPVIVDPQWRTQAKPHVASLVNELIEGIHLTIAARAGLASRGLNVDAILNA